MKRLELKWGLIIGAANLVWLYLSYYLGMHTSGIGMVQVMVVVAMLISVTGYILAFRDLERTESGFSFAEGLRSGAVVAVITAICALLTQLGYFKVIHPGFTEYMIGESVRYAETAGMSAEQIEEFAAAAKLNFGFKSYLIQSSVGALVTGTIFSVFILTIRHFRRRR